MIEIVTNNNFDFDNYEYAICECTSWDEGIQVPRKEDNYFASFDCPRCGRELGLFVHQRNIKNDNDTVSRKAVLDAIMGEPTDAHYPSWYAERIKALPPSPTVQPDSDTISRKQANDALKHDATVLGITPYDSGYTPFDAILTLHTLPPSPSRPHGHWIDKGITGDWAYCIDGHGNCWHEYKCSECNHIHKQKSNFCPHCGADMRGDRA